MSMLTIYSKPSCPYCERADEFLREAGVPFAKVDVTQDPDALALLRAEGHRTVPQIYKQDRLAVEGGFTGLRTLGPDGVRSLLG